MSPGRTSDVDPTSLAPPSSSTASVASPTTSGSLCCKTCQKLSTKNRRQVASLFSASGLVAHTAILFHTVHGQQAPTHSDTTGHVTKGHAPFCRVSASSDSEVCMSPGRTSDVDPTSLAPPSSSTASVASPTTSGSLCCKTCQKLRTKNRRQVASLFSASGLVTHTAILFHTVHGQQAPPDTFRHYRPRHQRPCTILSSFRIIRLRSLHVAWQNLRCRSNITCTALELDSVCRISNDFWVLMQQDISEAQYKEPSSSGFAVFCFRTRGTHSNSFPHCSRSTSSDTFRHYRPRHQRPCTILSSFRIIRLRSLHVTWQNLRCRSNITCTAFELDSVCRISNDFWVLMLQDMSEAQYKEPPHLCKMTFLFSASGLVAHTAILFHTAHGQQAPTHSDTTGHVTKGHAPFCRVSASEVCMSPGRTSDVDPTSLAPPSSSTASVASPTTSGPLCCKTCQKLRTKNRRQVASLFSASGLVTHTAILFHTVHGQQAPPDTFRHYRPRHQRPCTILSSFRIIRLRSLHVAWQNFRCRSNISCTAPELDSVCRISNDFWVLKVGCASMSKETTDLAQ